MGQYWIPVNLTKKEFIDPHKLGSGLKLWEQLANAPGTQGALIVLLAAMPDARGGGDLEENPVIGRWAGDRIAIVGDYAEKDDLASSLERESRETNAEHLYAACREHGEDGDVPPCGLFTDITDLVVPVLEKELDGKFTGTGWRSFEPNKT